MLERIHFSILLKFCQFSIWTLVAFIIINPANVLVAQDDVEEYWGDDEDDEDYDDEDEYLDDDAVFGVKDTLVLNWDTNASQEEAEKIGIWAPFCDIQHDIVLHPLKAARAAE